MRFKNYITEVLNIKKKVWTSIPLKSLDKETRQRLWDMYEATYKDIGLHVESVDKLLEKYKVSWLIDTDKDPEPDAFIIYKETPYGNKVALLGSDGGRLNKRLLIYKVTKLLKTGGWYVEASHKVAEIFISKGVDVIKDIDLIKKVLKKDDIKDAGNGEYTRSLGAIGVVKKRLFGKLK